MRGAMIFNPNAGSAAQIEGVRDWLALHPEIELLETQRSGHAAELAAQVRGSCELVIAAGGDGTISEVVNGLAPDFAPTTLGVVPLGTGNDLARTLGLPADPLQALDLLELQRARPIDVIRAQGASNQVYGINVAAGGFSGQVDEVLTDEMKATWGPLAYLISAASVLPDLSEYRTTIAFDDGSAEQVDALNVIVANGRTAAGGYRVAPRANPEDGLLDVVVVTRSSALDLAGVLARLLAGDYTQSGSVLYRQARALRIDSHPGMWFNVDGELLTNEPVTFTVLPQVLRVIVGPDYQPQVG